ncbi:MAG: 2-isopropylmalate synthase [Candidatus Bathyarchaeota archaeon]|nr:2-isopropylmalate synthase [Candidatus Bathyarchaeota archaeon]MCX8176722.1 2-isopropylmalate synthase [Candidatus Bathyarchaeota archaeon]MDW8193250.1 2-isopropylmalate synthase [Nitrososphaerota archaeon]
MTYIRIFDTTLRDGEQTPGVSLSVDEKIEIARQLDQLGVDAVEAGSPMSSEGEKEAVKEIAKAGLKAEVCALARTVREDIDAAIQCDVDSVHTFISASDIQIKHALGLTRQKVLQATVESVEYIKSHGLTCEFSPMDATRADIGFLKELCKAAEEAGADRINIPDTVGVMTPTAMQKLIGEVKSVVKVPISVHCHDDFGMAVANSVAGVEAGATQVHVTVNGLGERAGNAALEEVVMALHALYKYKTGINTSLLYVTSKLVSRLTGIPVPPNKAIVGENAFSHKSGIHTRGVTVEPSTFEPIRPELVGQHRRLEAGKLAGRQGIKAQLEEAGIYPTQEQLKTIVKRVKELGDKGKVVTDADLMAIARAVMGETVQEEKVVVLKDLAVVTGMNIVPMASVKLIVDGKEYISAETGVGPVDAAIRAIQKTVGSLADVKLREYRLEALTGGSDAVAEVIVKVEDKDGNIVSARGVNEDIVRASVEAMIEGINRCLIKKKTVRE